MKKLAAQFNLPVTFLREKNRFIAYSPAMDLSTSGKTFDEARRRFEEIAVLFFEELARKGTTAEVLEDLGWHKVKNDWKPPVVISQEPKTIRVPVAA